MADDIQSIKWPGAACSPRLAEMDGERERDENSARNNYSCWFGRRGGVRIASFLTDGKKRANLVPVAGVGEIFPWKVVARVSGEERIEETPFLLKVVKT